MDNSFLHTKRLLLVDDEQELLKMVSDILKDAGFETVLTAMTETAFSDSWQKQCLSQPALMPLQWLYLF